MILFTFDHEDSGNCRVYYKGNKMRSGRRALYCIQNDGAWGADKYVFYSCSRDGEPSHELRMPLDSSFDRKVMPKSLAK
jgi:hypothetical protein